MRKSVAGFTPIMTVLLVVLIILVAFVAYRVSRADETIESSKTITSFQECVAAGNPVMESYPEQCNADGQTFLNGEATLESPVTHRFKREGLNLSYFAKDWQKVEPSEEDSEECPYIESLIFSKDDFRFSIMFGSCGKGGATCFDTESYDPATCNSEYKVVNSVQVNNKTVHLLAVRHNDPELGASYFLTVTDSDTCRTTLDCVYPSRQVFEGHAQMTGSYSERSFGSLEEFTQSEEVKNIGKIVETFTY